MPEYIKFGKTSNGVFVDNTFINRLMPQANGAYVKVYLYALMKAENGEVCTRGDIADRLGMLESDVARAFAYWSEVGAIKTGQGSITFTGGQDLPAPSARSPQPAPAQPQNVYEHKPQTEDLSKRPDVGQAADAISENKQLSDMCAMAQEMLGKPLTAQDMSTLYWFYDTLGLPTEVILMLLEYCVSKDKRNMKYIERVALSWHENGIRTMEQVTEYMKKEETRGGYLNVIRKLMCMDRPFSQSEEEYLYKWRDSCGMGEDMVALAYEYCIIQISKVSFPYMDKIITRWHENGIHNVADAEQDNENFKRSSAPQTKQPTGYRQPEVFRDKTDHEELERIMWEKLNKN